MQKKYSYSVHWIDDSRKPQLHKIYSVNPLYLIINKINGYIEEGNKNMYLSLDPIGESKEILKKYE